MCIHFCVGISNMYGMHMILYTLSCLVDALYCTYMIIHKHIEKTHIHIYSRMGRCWLWGAGPPQTFSAQVGYLPGFLCGVCMFSPCSQGVSSNKNPNRKNMQKQNILLSVRDRDGRFTWSPGAEKLPTAPGCPGRTAQDG